jgi:phenylacetaldehyde dehydrogenase
MNEIRSIKSQPAYSKAAQAMLARKPSLFIDGEWVGSTHEATVPVLDPSRGCEIGRIIDASEADVDRAVNAARQAFDDGRWTGLAPMARERLIHRLADLIEANVDELSELEAIDNGKPRAMAAGRDIPAAVLVLRYMAGWATKISGQVLDPASLPNRLL